RRTLWIILVGSSSLPGRMPTCFGSLPSGRRCFAIAAPFVTGRVRRLAAGPVGPRGTALDSEANYINNRCLRHPPSTGTIEHVSTVRDLVSIEYRTISAAATSSPHQLPRRRCASTHHIYEARRLLPPEPPRFVASGLR